METHPQVAWEHHRSGRSSWGTVLANAARFIRPFGWRFIKTAGEDIPRESINQAVLWHPVRPTDFKHLELSCCATPPPFPALYLPHPHPTSTRAQEKKKMVSLQKHVQKHTGSHTVPPYSTHPANSLHLSVRTIFPGVLGVEGLQVKATTGPPALHLSCDIIKRNNGKCI